MRNPARPKNGSKASGRAPFEINGVSAPAGYRPGMHHLDPYAADGELYRVTAQNQEQYQAQLPAGLSDLLQRHRRPLGRLRCAQASQQERDQPWAQTPSTNYFFQRCLQNRVSQSILMPVI